MLFLHFIESFLFEGACYPDLPNNFFVCVKIIIVRNLTTMTFHAKVFSPHRHGIQTHKSSYIAYIHRNGEVKTQHSIVALPLSVAVFYSKMIWKCKFRHRYYKALLLLRWHCLFKFSLIYAIPLAGQFRKVKRKKNRTCGRKCPHHPHLLFRLVIDLVHDTILHLYNVYRYIQDGLTNVPNNPNGQLIRSQRNFVTFHYFTHNIHESRKLKPHPPSFSIESAECTRVWKGSHECRVSQSTHT